MHSKLKTHFYLKKPKNYNSGPIPVYLRITVGDLPPTELSTGHSCLIKDWDMRPERFKNTAEGHSSSNESLATLEGKVKDNYRFLREMEPDLEITASEVRDRLKGKISKAKTILEVFREHNEKVQALVGREFAPGTLERYETCLKHTADFINAKYKCRDLPLGRINHVFISEYDFYLRTVRNCNNNTTVKYIKNFKKILLICLASGYITTNPFLSYKSKLKPVNRTALTNEELRALTSKHFKIDRLNLVRDIFVFCCYTGLAYVDVKGLKRNNIVNGIDGDPWIQSFRQKTGTPVNVPILDYALELIKKYQYHPRCESYVFPVLSNQKMNAYLKEIADLCAITKELTFHIARHTFATTITLSNNVPIDTVSKMLGHTSIRTTQLYAKTMEKKISGDMALLKVKMAKLKCPL
ncbi:MAG: site-specific integrase [Bacteroidota bacterium]